MSRSKPVPGTVETYINSLDTFSGTASVKSPDSHPQIGSYLNRQRFRIHIRNMLGNSKMETDKFKFYDRESELKDLISKYAKLDSGELCILYGRRRLGKTLFVKEFMKKIKGASVYYFVNKANKAELLNMLSDTIFDQTGERERLGEWEDFFDYLYRKSQKEKFVFVMDEFSRLKDDSPEFLTKFQDYWDSRLSKTKIMFIAVGSSMSMMYDIFMDSTAPLYGRMTFKMPFEPFRYVDFRQMFEEVDERKKVEIYSVFGGTPHFLWSVKKHADKELIDIISELVLSRTAPLRDEPTDFITMELKKETNYNSVLHAISGSDGSKGEIISNSGVMQKDVDYYLNNLIDLLSIIRKVEPLFYNKRNRTRYRFTDNFFNFWYKFIFPSLSLIELGNKGLLKKKIEAGIDSFIGLRFEDIIKELLVLYNTKKIKALDIDFDAIGPWWGKDKDGNPEEIDIVTSNKASRQIIVCEVKWTNKPVDVAVIRGLDRKSRLIDATGTINYLIASKSGFTSECLKYMDEKKMTYLGLDDVKKLFEDA